jgi:hypothetical protein
MNQHHHGIHGAAHDLDHAEHNKFEHLAHYAHRAHLAAEHVEWAAEKLEHATEYVRHCEAAAKMLKAHAQMAFDLRRMHKSIATLEHMAQRTRHDGELLQRLEKAKAAVRAAESEFKAEGPAANAAARVLEELARLKKGAAGQGVAKLGELAGALEGVLGASRIGRTLLTIGRITASKTFVNGLVVVGTLCDAAWSYSDSTATTRGGKLVNGLLGGASGALIQKNRWVAAADLVTPKGYKLSEIYHAGAGAITAIGDSAVTKDSKAMDEFHRRSMQGYYGKVIQVASEAGEFWADKSIAGGLKEFVVAVHWWVTG